MAKLSYSRLVDPAIVLLYNNCMENREIYVVKEICGDYAVLQAENGDLLDISVFLLPYDLMIGDKLECVNMLEYRKMS